MNLQGIRRWHWVLIALLIGFAMAGVRQWVDAGRPLNGYGECLNDQWAFEAALTDEYRGVRRFKDIVVYPVQMDAGTAGSSRVHLVTGTYFDGHPQSHNGELQAVWTPRAFIAPVPFRTTVERGQSTKAGRTVLDILDGLPGVSYRYGWWQEPRWHYPIWVGGSVLLIGPHLADGPEPRLLRNVPPTARGEGDQPLAVHVSSRTHDDDSGGTGTARSVGV